MKKNKTRIIAIDLFCGAGGLTRGLLDAGIDVVAGFDVDKFSSETYEFNNIRSNGLPVKYIEQDVSTITKQQIIKLIGSESYRKKNKIKFLLAGCAPCQPFSQKNQLRYNLDDPRRTLIVYFANLIRELKPDFVFMENVAGLERSEPDSFAYFISILDDNKYYWDKDIVNAATYGVPQNRKRFVLLASIADSIKIPAGSYDGAINKFKTVEDTIKHIPAINAGETHSIIPNHKTANLREVNLSRLQYKNRIEWPEHLWLNCHKKENVGHKDAYGRMFWNKPAPTLTTKFFSISNGRFAHPEQYRAISLREGALLQSFPENYIFHGNSIQLIARQIGNAVPPVMAKSLVRAFSITS